MNVAKQTQIMWPKILVVVKFLKGLTKSKQPGKGKPGQNIGFDCLARRVNDPSSPLKLQFFKEIATYLNTFLINFQTDNPMILLMVLNPFKMFSKIYATVL